MNAKGYGEAIKNLMTIDFSKYDNGKDFSSEYEKGSVFYHAYGYIKYYHEKPQSVDFLIDEELKEELEALVKSINEQIDAVARTVVDPQYHGSFAYFVRSYWDTGYELHISKVSRKEREAERERAWKESERGRFIEENGYDPCDGCERGLYGGCKRCRFGDDGDYSIYDVYSMSELL